MHICEKWIDPFIDFIFLPRDEILGTSQIEPWNEENKDRYHVEHKVVSQKY